MARCEPPGLAFGKPEDRLREPRTTHKKQKAPGLLPAPPCQFRTTGGSPDVDGPEEHALLQTHRLPDPLPRCPRASQGAPSKDNRPSWQHRSNFSVCNRQCRLPPVSGYASSGEPSDARPGRVSGTPKVRSADQTNHPLGPEMIES